MVVVVGIRREKKGGRGRKCLTDSRKDSEQIQKRNCSEFPSSCDVCVYFFTFSVSVAFPRPFAMCVARFLICFIPPIQPPPPPY